METFAVDKSFYDIASADELKELWDSDLDPVSLGLIDFLAGGMGQSGCPAKCGAW